MEKVKEVNPVRSESKKGNKNPLYGKHHSPETKRKMSEARKGKSPWHKGKSLSEEHKRKIGLSRLEYLKKNPPITGEKHHNWKGGITPISRQFRQTKEFKLWRKAVFERDNYACIWCGDKFIKGVTGRVILNADHIKPFNLFPELRFAIDNGRTLCVYCHRKTDTYGVKSIRREVKK